MLPTDADLAGLCQAIYAFPGDPPVAWDHFDAGHDDGVCWAFKRLDGYDVAVMRGSDDPWDWFKDFAAVPISTAIGTVHAGFHYGTAKAWGEIRQLKRQPLLITGHSLGAAEASNVTAWSVVDNDPAVRRVVFGEPKPGFPDHAAIVAKVPGASYCNGFGAHLDLVTDVPFTLPPAFPFTRGAPLTMLAFRPRVNDPWGPLAFHHIQDYAAGVAALTKENA